jgi:hypothetical protein
MIKKLVEIIDYEGHLKKTQQDWESRWENVRELITFASEVESELLFRERQMEALSGPPASQYVLFTGDTHSNQLLAIQEYLTALLAILDAFV